MNVTAQNHDDVSALLTVTLDKSDYKDKVEKQLINYAKKAQIPGFRKGKVPLSMVRRQYEGPITADEVNKQISEALNKYVDENKLRLVGQPVPVPTDNLDLQADSVSVGFEVGYEPNFTIDLSKYEAPHYTVEAGDKEIGQSIENMQKRFADREDQHEISEDSYIQLTVKQVVAEENAAEHQHAPKTATISKDQNEAFELVKDLKKGDKKTINKSEIQSNDELAKQLGFNKSEAELLHHDELEIEVSAIYKLNPHELNEELFGKIYGEGNIKTEDELKEKVKTELNEYFQQNADVHFVNKVLEQITEKEEVQLPENFLVKWLMFSNENIKTEEQAKEILEKEKNVLKHQIIEGKLLNDNDIKIDYADVLAQAETLVRNQLAIYGIHHLNDDEIQKYAVEMLKDQEQVRQISSEVAMSKLKDVILEKATKKSSQISHDEFLEEIKEK